MEMLLWYFNILQRHSSHSSRSSICTDMVAVLKQAAACPFRLTDGRRADAPYAGSLKNEDEKGNLSAAFVVKAARSWCGGDSGPWERCIQHARQARGGGSRKARSSGDIEKLPGLP